MRIRILKDCYSPFGLFKAGQIADIPEPEATEWLETGLAMQDKAVESSENKSEQVISPKRNTRRSK
ncbi:hypothetical protein [Dehalococcoides mccartyi]|uniref:hypothetical protein n=1 Tax=Dehalococcoides mccartyi TaxID=61435 RepID=UPI0007505E97|nr:hypothetical protein [Dehalococcoides mccartyi]